MRLHLWAMMFAILSGCAEIFPVALAQLSRLDPLTTDPSLIAAKVSLPDGLGVRRDSAVLSVTVQREDTGEALSERYVLERDGEIWRLSDADAEAFRQMQRIIGEWKRAGGDGTKGALSVSVGGCASKPAPDVSGSVSVWLSMDGGTSFLPFLRDVQASGIVGDTIAAC